MKRAAVPSILVAVVMLALGVISEAQQSGQKFRVGYLSAGVAVARKPYLDAFRLGMRDFGFVEGENLILETRFAEGKYDRLPALAEDLAQVKPDVILASTSLAVLAAKKLIPSIPIVMVAVGNPVGAGLVASLARPGGNVTGITNINSDLAGKCFGAFKRNLAESVARRRPHRSQLPPLFIADAQCRGGGPSPQADLRADGGNS